MWADIVKGSAHKPEGESGGATRKPLLHLVHLASTGVIPILILIIQQPKKGGGACNGDRVGGAEISLDLSGIFESSKVNGGGDRPSKMA
ncbi:MAG: hypothetical protein VKJ64_06035 [Leptolyngbyaceae bacterium]|nr:hypothetical protein [Leptolyngbyaceae bacterium]